MQFLQDQIPFHLGDIEGIARAVKASAFFFELRAPIHLHSGRYECTGTILSRSPDNHDLVRNLLQTHPQIQFFKDDVSLGILSLADICDDCGRFQKLASFQVRHPSDRVDLQLVFSRLFRRSISGFPQSMEWFMEKQEMNSRFGRPDHQSQRRAIEPACPCESIPAIVPESQKRRIEPRRTPRKRRRVW